MSLIQTPWTSQPQQAVGIDRSVLSPDFIWIGSAPSVDLSRGHAITLSGTRTQSLRSSGVHQQYSDNGYITGRDNSARNNITYIGIVLKTGGGSYPGVWHTSSSNSGWSFAADALNNFGLVARPSVQMASVNLATGVPYVVVASRKIGSNYIIARPMSGGTTLVARGSDSSSATAGDGTYRIGRGWDSALVGSQSLCVIAYQYIDESVASKFLDNPWQIFKPLPRRIFVPVATGGGTTAVTSDHNASYTITGSVAADASAAYAIRAAVTADATASYALRAAVAADATASYALRAAAQADQAAAYAIRAAVASDLAGSYAIQTAGTVTTGLDAAYAVRGSVAGDISVGYQIAAAVQSEVAAAYAVRAAVQRDLAAGYTIDAGVSSVAATLSAAYWIDGEAVILTPDDKFTARGAARNKTVTAAARRYQIATRSS